MIVPIFSQELKLGKKAFSCVVMSTICYATIQLSTPHTYISVPQDGQWSIFHFIFAVASPVPMSIFFLIIVKKWEGIITLVNGQFPLSLIIFLCGKVDLQKKEDLRIKEEALFYLPDLYCLVCMHMWTISAAVSPLSVVLFFTLSRKKPPHWIMQWLLMLLAFVMSVAWLKVIADEVVSILQALGLLSGISTGETPLSG